MVCGWCCRCRVRRLVCGPRGVRRPLLVSCCSSVSRCVRPPSSPPSPLPPLPPRSFPRFPLCCLLFVLPGLGRNVGAPHQTPTGHAVTARDPTAAPRGLARRLLPAFSAGVAGKTRRFVRCHGGYRRRRPPFLPTFRPLKLHRDRRSYFLAISVCVSLYF